MFTLTLIVAAGFIFLAYPYCALAFAAWRWVFGRPASTRAPHQVSLFAEESQDMTIQSADNVRMLSDKQIFTLENR